MEYLLLYDKKDNERRALMMQSKDAMAFLSDDYLDIYDLSDIEAVNRLLDNDKPVDMAMMEISCDEEVALSKTLRNRKGNIWLMLVAEPNISPMKYLRPEIRACSLILRPFDMEQLKEISRQFMKEYFREKRTGDNEESLLIENRAGKILIPLFQIYYIEVREKKIYVRLRDKEYTKYETLEHIRSVLPDNFIQCHRSFLFNTMFLERVKLSENTVYLEHGITVPLSRSFKADVKEYLNGLSAK